VRGAHDATRADRSTGPCLPSGGLPSSAWKRFNEYNSDRDSILTREELLTMPELSVNPFRERIATVFSSDGSGNMTFEDFLDFLSVFGAKARRGRRHRARGRTWWANVRANGIRLTCAGAQASADLKSSYAFRIYGAPTGRCLRTPAAAAAALMRLLLLPPPPPSSPPGGRCTPQTWTTTGSLAARTSLAS